MAQQHRQDTAEKHVTGEWAKRQKTWTDKEHQKAERSQQQQSSATDARATDDEPTDGEGAQKQRDKMQHQEKAEGERRD
jgi:hypothetical protein